MFPSGERTTTAPARAAVTVSAGVFSTRQVLVGRVFVDTNGNGQFDSSDRPAPGVRLYLSNGQSVITDSAGMYNFPSLGDGAQVVSLDPVTVPRFVTVPPATTLPVRTVPDCNVIFPPVDTRFPDNFAPVTMIAPLLNTGALVPGVPTQFIGNDGRLEVDVPADAVTTADVLADGGSASLLVRQILPPSGANAGGSGRYHRAGPAPGITTLSLRSSDAIRHNQHFADACFDLVDRQ